MAAVSIQVLTDIFVRQSIGLCVSCMYVHICVYVISNQSTDKIHAIYVKPLVNLTPYYIKHTEMSIWY